MKYRIILIAALIFQVCLADYTYTDAENDLIKGRLIKLKQIEDTTPEVYFDAYVQTRTWDKKFYSPNFLTGTLEVGSITHRFKYPFQPIVEFKEKPERYPWQPTVKFGFIEFNQSVFNNYDFWGDCKKVLMVEPLRYRKCGVNLIIGNPFWGISLSRDILQHLEGHIGVIKEKKYYLTVGFSFDLIEF